MSRFDAPDGTEITRLRYNRYLGKQDDDDWLRFLRGALGSIIADETCNIAQGDDNCRVGDAGSDQAPSATSAASPPTASRWHPLHGAERVALLCDYTYARPCGDFNGPLSLDTARYGNGAHAVEIRTTDAAGNEASETRTGASDRRW